MQPLVSIITPTTISRAHFIPGVIGMVQLQDYPNVEHIIVDDERLTVGEKRNIGCARAKGDIILHMDSDDMYASDWVSRSVAALGDNDVTGLSQLYFFKQATKELWLYKYNDDPFAAYAAGATLCYWKSFWEGNKFRHINLGEDTRFVLDRPCKIKSHGYADGFIARVHEDNTCDNNFRNYRWKKMDDETIGKLELLRPLV